MRTTGAGQNDYFGLNLIEYFVHGPVDEFRPLLIAKAQVLDQLAALGGVLGLDALHPVESAQLQSWKQAIHSISWVLNGPIQRLPSEEPHNPESGLVWTVALLAVAAAVGQLQSGVVHSRRVVLLQN